MALIDKENRVLHTFYAPAPPAYGRTPTPQPAATESP